MPASNTELQGKGAASGSRWAAMVFSRLAPEDNAAAASTASSRGAVPSNISGRNSRSSHNPSVNSTAHSNQKDAAFSDLTPVQKPKKHKRCCGIIWTRARLIWCAVIAVVLLVITILLAIFVFGPKIAQSAIDGATMTLGATSIKNATDSAFILSSIGKVTNAGFLDATLNFPTPVKVIWTNRPNNAPDVQLGTLTVAPITVGGGLPKSGDIQLQTVFNIADTKAMGTFADYMINTDTFSWLLQGGASATAFGVNFNGLSLNKVVTVGGMKGLKDVSIQSFAPLAGPTSASVGLTATILLVNPSDISIELGDLFMKFMLGSGPGTLQASKVFLGAGNTMLDTKGVVEIPPGDSLSNQIQGLGNNIQLKVEGDHVESPAGRVGWLNDAVSKLRLTVTMNLTTIAQNIILGANLSLSSASINQIQENSFNLVGAGAVTNAGVLDATLKFPKPVAVFWTARPNSAADIKIGELSLSSVAVGGDIPKRGEIKLSTTFQVTDSSNMADFATYMIQGMAFSWRLSGEATANAFGLDIPNLSLSKVVTLNGFNGLPNPNIKSFDLPNSDSNGIHVVTTAEVSNPSTITIDIGSAAFDLMYNGVVIGALGSSNTVLVPGANSLNLDGRMKSGDSSLLSGLFTTFLTGGGLKATAVGKSSTVNNQQPSWLNKAIKSLSLPVSLPSPQLSSPIVSNLQIPSMSLTFDPSDTSGLNPRLTASGVTAQFSSPFSFRIGVTGAQANLKFLGSNGQPFAEITVPMGPASLDPSGKVVTLSINDQKLSALPGQDQAFSEFMRDVVIQSNVNVAIQGSIIAQADTDAGSATISGLPLSGSIPIAGLNGFAGIILSNVVAIGGTDNVGLSINTMIPNPSKISLFLKSEVFFSVFLNGAKIGEVTVPDFSMIPGDNTYSARVKLRGVDGNAANILNAGLTKFINNQANPVLLPGRQGSSIYRSLDLALSSLNPPASFPGEGGSKLLVGTGLLNINIFPISLTAVLPIRNPLGTTLTLLQMSATVSFQGKSIGTVTHTFSRPMVIGSLQTVSTEPLKLNPIISLAALNLILPILQQSLAIDVESTITAKIDGFPTTIDYNQNGVPISVRL
ncbi:hypothetical protein HDU77_004311 [Chytriomyces hyalinus]|nr:hypothetical protein HDU77_004311 [Chytriomyces hyalinus]